MEILLPVIDPVKVFCLIYSDASLTYFHISPDIIQGCSYIIQSLLDIGRSLFDEEAKVSHTVIRLALGRYVHKHLLLLKGRQRNLILNLGSLQSVIIELTDYNIFRICYCLNSYSCPLHPCFLRGCYLLTYASITDQMDLSSCPSLQLATPARLYLLITVSLFSIDCASSSHI